MCTCVVFCPSELKYTFGTILAGVETRVLDTKHHLVLHDRFIEHVWCHWQQYGITNVYKTKQMHSYLCHFELTDMCIWRMSKRIDRHLLGKRVREIGFYIVTFFHRCKTQVYSETLPAASIILCFYNEAWSVILRSLHSIKRNTPDHLLREIVLVDDNSTLGELVIIVFIGLW